MLKLETLKILRVNSICNGFSANVKKSAFDNLLCSLTQYINQSNVQ